MPSRATVRMASIVRREFLAFVRTRAYLLGTLFGPLMIALVILLPVWLLEGGGEERTIAIVDETRAGIGARVAAAIDGEGPQAGAESTRYSSRILTAPPESGEDPERMAAWLGDSLDGVLWLPGGLLAGQAARYQGENATSGREMGDLRSGIQRAVQAMRLEVAGIDAEALEAVFRPVELEAREASVGASSGPSETLVLLAQLMSFAIYFMVIFYAIAVARGVQEEKRDRIVEILLSSVSPETLMSGKILGIVAAGLLQVTIWAAFAALVLTFGDGLLERLGAHAFELPQVPPTVGLLFIFYLAGGFFLYACIYAALGAVATSDQEVQQLQFPVLLPLFIGFFLTFAALQDSGGTAAVAGSLVPLTSPLVMPVRATVGSVPPIEMAASILLLVATSALVLWLGARIYRVSILSTSRRPSLVHLWRSIRSAPDPNQQMNDPVR